MNPKRVPTLERRVTHTTDFIQSDSPCPYADPSAAINILSFNNNKKKTAALRFPIDGLNGPRVLGPPAAVTSRASSVTKAKILQKLGLPDDFCEDLLLSLRRDSESSAQRGSSISIRMYHRGDNPCEHPIWQTQKQTELPSFFNFSRHPFFSIES